MSRMTVKELADCISTLPIDDAEVPVFVYDKATKTDYPIEALAYVSAVNAPRIFIDTGISGEKQPEEPASIEDAEHKPS